MFRRTALTVFRIAFSTFAPKVLNLDTIGARRPAPQPERNDIGRSQGVL